MASVLSVDEALNRVQAIADNLRAALSTPGASDVGLRARAIEQVREIANSVSADLGPGISTYLERIPVMFEHSQRGAGNSCIL